MAALENTWYFFHTIKLFTSNRGESAFKECSNVQAEHSFFNLRYPFWHDHGLVIRGCDILSPEFGWSSRKIEMENCDAESEYFMMRSFGLRFTNVRMKGKYSFQYIKDSVFENCTFKNCRIIGTQPLCYCKGLKLINCEMEGCDLAFERSEVEATITTPVVSIKNPLPGSRIIVPEVGEIIRDIEEGTGTVQESQFEEETLLLIETYIEHTAKHICAGLLAHVDAGKTTLSEAILFLTGKIRKQGRVDNRNAYLDTYELERARGITIFAKQAVVSLGDRIVTLVDTPGHVDFSAEMERTLSVLDYAVLVINGSDGVQGHTETLWRLLARYRIPVFLFVNKMDLAGCDKDGLLKELKGRLDGAVTDFTGPEEDRLEEIAACSEELLESYLETGMVDCAAVRRAIRERQLFPCYFGSALKLTGVEEFLKGFADYSVCPDYPENFGARVFKISRDELGNRLTHLKITGGSLRVKDSLDGTDNGKVNQIRIYSGAKFEPAQEAEAGTICAVTGPADTRPGQGFGMEAEAAPPVLEPVLTYEILLPEGTDAHGMLKNLRILEEEDPALHITWNEALGEIQAQVMGDVQMEILKSQVLDRFGVEIGFGAGEIVYKETIQKTVEGVGHFEPLRHYAEVHLLMEPLETGSGLVLETDCSEDMLDRNWQRLILTHLEEKRHRGVLTGSEITDMKISLIAGRAHIKHTEGGDFRQATYRAVRQGLKEAGCRLLEPFYEFVLELPAENLGRAMADVERMQGSFHAPSQTETGAVLTGIAPVSEMRDYQQEVISYTRGRGRLSLRSAGYRPCHNEEEVIQRIGYDFDSDIQDPAGSVFCFHGAGVTVPWNEVKKYMQVESRFAREQSIKERETRAGQEPCQTARAGAGNGKTGAAGSGSLGKSYYMDRELEEIFNRTFGPPKRAPQETGRTVIRAGGQGEKKRRPAGPEPYSNEEQEEDYLLVDGYNIIFAWDELRELAETNIDGARYRLMDLMSNYQGTRKGTLILVFDAYKVAGNTGEDIRYHNIHVIYTKEAETADQYIEKLAHQMGRKNRVTVATSDGLEQLIIRGQGCMLLSAEDLKEDVERARRMVEEERAKLSGKGKNYLLSHADQDTRSYLEEMRLGTEKGQEKGEEKTAGSPFKEPGRPSGKKR